MAVGDCPVKVCSQEVSYRDTITMSGGAGTLTYVRELWYVYMLPRQFLWMNQSGAGVIAVNVLIEWAIADSASAGVPEWLTYDTIILVPGGLTPVRTLITTGAVWLRFTAIGRNGDIVNLACTAFL